MCVCVLKRSGKGAQNEAKRVVENRTIKQHNDPYGDCERLCAQIVSSHVEKQFQFILQFD